MTTVIERVAPIPTCRPLDRRLVRATYAIAALVVVAAGAGVFLHPYAGDTVFARNGYRGADVISLAIAAPLLVYAVRSAARGSTRARLLWLGGLGYVVYQYGYTFAYGWSRLFLVYLALLSLSAFTLTAALASLAPESIAARFDDSTPTRRIARFLIFIGAGLGVMELAQIIPTVFTGDTPQIVLDTGHPTSPVYILDIGFVVPLMLLAGTWLKHQRPWGYVAAAVLLVKGMTVGLGLLAANVFAVVGDAKNDGALNALWAAIAGGSAFMLWQHLRHVDERAGERR